MGFSVRLKRIIDESGLSMDAFANKCGVSKSSLQRYLQGRNEPKISFLTKLVITFGINPVWLLTGSGDLYRDYNVSVIPVEPESLKGDREYFLVPVIRVRVAADLLELSPSKILNWIAMEGEWFTQWGATTMEKIRSKFVFVRADGNNMSPTVVDGDIVLVDRNRDGRMRIINDAIYLIRDQDGGVSLRRLASCDGRTIFCINDNHLEYSLYELTLPEDAPLEDYVLGRAVWICKKMG